TDWIEHQRPTVLLLVLLRHLPGLPQLDELGRRRYADSKCTLCVQPISADVAAVHPRRRRQLYEQRQQARPRYGAHVRTDDHELHVRRSGFGELLLDCHTRVQRIWRLLFAESW